MKFFQIFTLVSMLSLSVMAADEVVAKDHEEKKPVAEESTDRSKVESKTAKKSDKTKSKSACTLDRSSAKDVK